MPKTSEALHNPSTPHLIDGISSTWSSTPAPLFQQQLNWALQKTLRVETQLHIYFQALVTRFHADGIKFSDGAGSINITIGKNPKRHKFNDNLYADSELLGVLEIYRNKNFNPEEISGLKSSTLSLAYPLRNAIQFQSAIKNALTDPLTGASNRMAMEERLEQEIQSFRRYNRTFSIAMFDLDRFKQINDRYGHQAGDQVLIHLVNSIEKSSRSTDKFFRYGGEEFLMLMADTDNEGAMIKAERLRAMVAGSSCVIDNVEIPVTVSIGVTTVELADDIRSLIQRADQGLYQAKNNGRNLVINHYEHPKSNCSQ